VVGTVPAQNLKMLSMRCGICDSVDKGIEDRRGVTGNKGCVKLIGELVLAKGLRRGRNVHRPAIRVPSAETYKTSRT
jgi:hypothetical protein